ncbi:MAG TPA: fibronectin-binding domain-containing protein [Methanomicrobia archaeon]|nr:fibronectin-binding domain-containing protein [Methanomicrobia archaeon]
MLSLDIKVIIEELKELSIIDMKIEKIYQKNGEFRFKLYGNGRKDLVIKPGICIFVTQYPKEAPRNPSGFAMFMRKKLHTLRIKDIRQIDLDRIVEIDTGLNEIMYRVIIEFFGEGNIILTDRDYKILALWKKHHKREIYVGNYYKFPESKNIFKDFKIEKIDREIVKILAVEYNLGGPYAEELCHLSGIDKNSKEIDIKKLKEGIKKLESMEKKVNLVDGEIYSFELSKYKNKEKKYYNSLNEAFDDIYGKEELIGEKSIEKKKIEEKIEKYKRIASEQKRAIERFEEEINENKEIGDLIYLHYSRIEKAMDLIKKSKNREQILQKLKYVDILNSRTLRFRFEKNIDIDISKSLSENAEYYYEKSKTAKKKLEGAKSALQKTLNIIKNLEEGKTKIKEVIIKKRRKREWYEKFRWCFSGEKFLILGGKDKKTNELLIKKHMEPKDLYLHADIYGAPHIIIKNGQESSEKTLNEAAIFAASFSRAWKEKIAGIDVYWVYPEQVTKSPPSGEYLPTGAFFIKGEKNFIKNVPLSLGVGIFENKPMCGPLSAVKANCKRYVEIIQGDEKKESLAKKISRILEYDNIDDIVQVLPPGGSKIGRR